MDSHPVELTVTPTSAPNRVLAAVGVPFFVGRALLLVPAFIVLWALMAVGAMAAWIGLVVIAATGRPPAALHRVATGALRWQVRTTAYLWGLTDRYPTLG